jgi:AraC family transcriptional regulator
MASPTVLVRQWEERSHGVQAFRVTAHEAYELAWVETGHLEYRVGRRRFTADEGSVIVVPAGVEHATSITQGTRAVSMHLSPQLVRGVAEALGPEYRRRQIDAGIAAAGERMVRLGSLLEQEASGGPSSDLAAGALAEALATQLVRGAPERLSRAREHDPRILRAVQLAEDVRGEEIDVDDMARAAGMSRYHFSRLFKQVVGTSPYRYLLEVKLARAAELLRRRRLSVTEAAVEAGFSDFGRFAAHFRRSFGCRPSEMSRAR